MGRDKATLMESLIEKSLFNSKIVLAPFFFGLILAIVVVLGSFLWDLLSLLQSSWGNSNLVVSVVKLVDKTLIATLMLVIAFSGYETFVSRISVPEELRDHFPWLGTSLFSTLKLRLIGIMVVITGLDLLEEGSKLVASEGTEKVLTDLGDPHTHYRLAWKVGIHLTFVISGVLFALTDRIAEGRGEGKSLETGTGSAISFVERSEIWLKQQEDSSDNQQFRNRPLSSS